MRFALASALLALGCYNFDVQPPNEPDCGDGILDPGEVCDDGNNVGGDGCEADCTLACELASDCQDDDRCTDNERCEAGRCVADPVDPSDDDLCTLDACDPDAGVTNTPLPLDDNNDCTVDLCDPEDGLSHLLIDVDDQNDCTLDACDPDGGAISHEPIGDGAGCAILGGGAGVCLAGVCVAPTCGDGGIQAGESCDDGNTTANDGCSPACQVEAELFVLCGGGAGGDGSLEAPFSTLTEALGAALSGQRVMILPSSPQPCEAAVLNEGVTLFGLADPGAADRPAPPIIDGQASAALTIASADRVTVRDLVLRSASATGTLVSQGALVAALRVDLSNSGASADAVALDCNPGGAGGFLLLDQSVVRDSPAGGARVRGGCSFVAANSLFARNGAANGSRGAVEVEAENAHAALVLSTFDTNRAAEDSILDLPANQAQVLSRVVGVIVNDNNTNNGGQVNAFDAQLEGNGLVSSSNIVGENVAGDALLNLDPLFVTLGAGFTAPFHLDPASPCRDLAVSTAVILFDTLALFGVDVRAHDFAGNPRAATTDLGLFDE